MHTVREKSDFMYVIAKLDQSVDINPPNRAGDGVSFLAAAREHKKTVNVLFDKK